MTVYLVGVGPGDAELMTLKAARLLAEADAVVYDRLIGSEVLSHAAPTAERYCVGKTPGQPSPSQEEINDLLVALGQRLETVVRAKGGDPSVFGRGAEEADACHSAGIRTETVPGISSAIYGPTAAGISVTRRGVSSGFCVITAHQDPHSIPVNWQALAQCGLSLVILMGAKRAAAIRDQLMLGGLDSQTPVAVVTDASLATQRSHRLTLAELGQIPIASPSVIVVGEVTAAEWSTAPLVGDHGHNTRISVSPQTPKRG